MDRSAPCIVGVVNIEDEFVKRSPDCFAVSLSTCYRRPDDMTGLQSVSNGLIYQSEAVNYNIITSQYSKSLLLISRTGGR